MSQNGQDDCDRGAGGEGCHSSELRKYCFIIITGALLAPPQR